VVLSQDIFKVAPEEILQTRVEYTIVGGKIVWGLDLVPSHFSGVSSKT